MNAFPPTRIGLGLLLLLLAFSASAADPGTTPTTKSKRQPAAEAAVAEDPWMRKLQEVDLNNFPIAELAAYLSEQGRFPEINFVLDPGVKDMPVTLKLRSVTLDDIFTALGIATENPGSGVDASTGLPISHGLQINKLSDRMVSITSGPALNLELSKPICRAFSLARYMGSKSREDADKALTEVEDVLQLCWTMLSDADHSGKKADLPRLSLHRGTKLLIVVGQPSQMEVVEQVISQLEGSGSPGDTSLAVPAAEAREFLRRYGLAPATPASTNSPLQSR